MRDRDQAGFTMIEIMITIVIIAPILIAIASTRDVITENVSANQRRAEDAAHGRDRQRIRAAVIGCPRQRDRGAQPDRSNDGVEVARRARCSRFRQGRAAPQ